jgi:sulfotransferase
MAILSNRLNSWANNVVGGTFNAIQDAFFRGHGKKFHFIDYENLTTDPKEQLDMVYNFLGKPYFKHDFQNIEQYTHENDIEHGFTDLHTIRPIVKPQNDDSKEILGPFYDQFSTFHYNFYGM